MKKWPLQEAKNQFSRVVELAQTEGPQTVTRHGERTLCVPERLRDAIAGLAGLGPGVRPPGNFALRCGCNVVS